MKPLPPGQQGIREAARDLVRAFGGQDAVGARFGIDQRRISEHFAPESNAWRLIDWILTMERETRGHAGHPHVTTALARATGHVVIAIPEGPSDHDAVAGQLMSVTAELGDVAGEWRDALRDGTVKRSEALRVLDQIDEMLTAASGLRALVHAIAWPADRERVSTLRQGSGQSPLDTSGRG